jgi:transposase InsO family protein
MPLKVMDVVELRRVVLAEVDRGESVASVCRRYGIARETYYVWRRRFDAEGDVGLVPRSRRPLGSPGRVPAEVEDAIVRIRKDYPRWGPKKIAAVLTRQGVSPPAVSTIGRVLVRRGLVVPSPRPRRAATRRFERGASNELWQTDASMHRLADGTAFWVVDLIDDHSRFLTGVEVGMAPTGALAWRAFRGAAARYGLPGELLSDNGLTFTGRLHQVTVSFERQVRAAGVAMIHARPYHPQTCGKTERVHATLRQWLATRPPPVNLDAAATLFAEVRRHYNHDRPHEAIGQATPAQRYRPSTPIQLPPIDLDPADTYPHGCRRRRVGDDGAITYARTRLRIGDRWAGVEVGLIRRGPLLHVYYGAAEIDCFILGTTEPQRRGRNANPQEVSGMSSA